VGPRNRVLDGVQITHGKGKGANHSKVQGHSAVICAKTAEPIEVTFPLWARMGPRNHVLDGGPDSPWEGAILGIGASIVKYRDFLSRAVQKRLTRSIFRLCRGLQWAEGGVNLPDDTLP